MKSKVQDVVIIGGGPAGSTAATILARHGHSVTLLEKEKFPREHVGESLLPFCYDVLQRLGVMDDMVKKFVRKPGVRFIDVDGSQHTTWCFAHVIKDESYLSFHVIRSEFDQLLLENSRKSGVVVNEETRVTQVDLDQPDGLVRVVTQGINGEQVYQARFLLDASGRDTFLANTMRTKKPHKGLDRTALNTHWTGAKYIEGIEEGLLQIVYLGGDKQGWLWVIPVREDRLSIGVVLNHAYIRRRKAELIEQGIDDWQHALYSQEIMSSQFVADILANAEIAQPIAFNGNFSYFVEKKYGSNYGLIGDAGTFIDPIFASGVYLSIKSAQLVADSLHNKLVSAENDTDTYLDQAYTHINGAYGLVDRAIRLFYQPDAINFAQLGAAAPVIHQQHENVMALGHYLLAGDFFENHEKYSRFLDLLGNPTMFEGYKKMIIDREEFQASSCGMQRSQIFAKMLEDTTTQAELQSVPVSPVVF